VKLEYLRIQNYKALKDVYIPLSRFVCLIGENNTGKSSLLRAINLFVSGASISADEFYDPEKEVRIEIGCSEIDREDLNRLAEEHRTRIAEILSEGKLTLVRVYSTDGKGRLFYRALMPRDPRFLPTNVSQLVAGQRAGREFVRRVLDVFPELTGVISASMNQTQIRKAINELGDSLPKTDLVMGDKELPTGFDRSVTPFLPEPILIPAVKDLADDMKAKDSASFGRTLRILFDDIEQELAEETALFERLERKLNPVVLENGSIVQDERLKQLIQIESLVEQFVQESFQDVRIKIHISPPQLRTIFQGAEILADDGVEGPIDTKGDGLRRATVFAILRTYVELIRAQNRSETRYKNASPRYLLLFEEPELYLHPTAQLVLFDALNEFAKHHAVVMSTHSPLFLGPEATATFVKLQKTKKYGTEESPFSEVLPIDLSEINAKDQFQLICYENNNAAFFANTVVLVEGDSDLIVLPHIARTINPEWDASRSGVYFAKINGKTSIRRYRQFFERFGVRTPVITDLDLLVNDFDQIDPTEELKEARARLLEKVDRMIEEQRCDSEDANALPTKAQAKEMQKSAKSRILCRNLIEALKAAKDGTGTVAVAESAYAEFYEYIQKDDRLSVLEEETDPEFIAEKRKLLALLREQDVYVLERGSIEAYYPENIEGHDKPTKAKCFCNTIKTKDEILRLCAEHDDFTHNGCSKEFCLIFGRIFEPTVERSE